MNGYKNISVAELQPLLAAGKVKLVDVRTDAEVVRGFIKIGRASCRERV